ncbi:rRNA pseudouridine synthase [Brucepastera parasyntrophica]|uniref:pseudouridine synthase n=1 Tax=Brucepastera parasyntrophica TaxID=2880008 RepID=UPI00210861A1|nr:pseudouridine synthase [Brucepastera parasyntrophica]ULQ60244.1 rRNA pseudouridine synthase [Brucepastera parasyntrophica]
MNVRLDKILGANGFGSRRDIKRMVRSGALTLNDRIITDPSVFVDPQTDSFFLNGAPLHIRTSVYLMLNKPQGTVTSTGDPVYPTVMDLLGEPFASMSLFPVGRLDYDTEGLLIITNDGPLTHRLTSPKTGVNKTYYVRLRDPVDDRLFSEYEQNFRKGISFHNGYTCLPAVIERAGDGPGSMLLTIQEGKFHQVKKMFKASGNEVVYLRRIAMGNLLLDEQLLPGSYRELTREEIAVLCSETV